MLQTAHSFTISHNSMQSIMSLPPSFVDLQSVPRHLNAEVNIMGVVTDFLLPQRSRGTDWMRSFSITDLSFGGLGDDGLKIRYFRPTESEMPAIMGTGDVVLLRSIKIKEWSGMTIGLSSRATSWIVFPAASIPSQMPHSHVQLTHAKEARTASPSPVEIKHAIALCNSRDRSTFTIPSPSPNNQAGASSSSAPAMTQGRREKFSLIKDVETDTYYDIVGQVVKLYPSNGRVELYVTDYTSNNLLWNYEWGQDEGIGREGDVYNYTRRESSKKNWPGPFGKMTLTVTLWPPHSSFGEQNVKQNDFVHLRNVHIKWSKDSKLEGVLHSDRYYPDRVDVTILTNNESDDRVKDVLRRKRDYTKKFESQAASFIGEARALKRKQEDESKPLSKTQARKRRKQEREQLASKKCHDIDELEDKENSEQGPSRRVQNTNPTNATLPKSLRQDLNKNGQYSIEVPLCMTTKTVVNSKLLPSPHPSTFPVFHTLARYPREHYTERRILHHGFPEHQFPCYCPHTRFLSS